MTKEQKGMIVVLQQRGFGYRKIAEETGLPMEAVKTYCRRHPITEADGEKGLCPLPGKIDTKKHTKVE